MNENEPKVVFQDTVDRCLGLRWNNGVLEQQLRIRRVYLNTAPLRVEIIEQWMAVPGMAKRYSNSKWTRNVNWSQVDWSKNNQQIGKELNCNPVTVAKFRRRMKAPPSPGIASRNAPKPNAVVTPEMIASANWALRDVALAREWGVTRERVRQIRLFHGPKSKRESDKAAEWLHAHAAELKELTKKEIIPLMPGNLTAMTKGTIIQQSGIPHRRSPHPRAGEENIKNVNYELPNTILAMVYGKGMNRFANYRSRKGLGPSRWFTGGLFSTQVGDLEFQDALRKEIENAKSQGFPVNEEAIWKHIEQRLQRTAEANQQLQSRRSVRMGEMNLQEYNPLTDKKGPQGIA